MRYLLVLVFIGAFQLQSLRGQDLAYAHSVVDTLAGPAMKGRGYVQDGVSRAAEYIAQEFDKLGLKRINKNFFQKFNAPVNTFPGKMELAINDSQLMPGRDFLIEPGSPEITGKYDVVSMTYSDLLDREAWIPKARSAAGKFLVIDSRDTVSRTFDEEKAINEILGFFKYHPESPAKGTIIISNDKLTWGGATEVLANPSFTILGDKINEEITSINLKVENRFFESYKMKNVIGMVEGDNPDSVIILSAHYDHLGMMGKTAIFPGANDNASGVAILLNLAKYYTEYKPKYSIAFMAFAAEEIGLLGSKYYTENPLFPLKKIKFMINFDIAGTGDDGIQVVNGSVFKDEFELMRKINESDNLLPQVKIRGEACNSDHCLFYQKGVPSFFIYTLGGIQAYHDIDDRPETLPLTAFENYFKLITNFVERL